MGARKPDRPPKFSLRGFLFVIMWYNIRKSKALALRRIVIGAPPLFLLRRNTILQVGSLKYAEAELLRLEKLLSAHRTSSRKREHNFSDWFAEIRKSKALALHYDIKRGYVLRV